MVTNIPKGEVTRHCVSFDERYQDEIVLPKKKLNLNIIKPLKLMKNLEAIQGTEVHIFANKEIQQAQSRLLETAKQMDFFPTSKLKE